MHSDNVPFAASVDVTDAPRTDVGTPSNESVQTALIASRSADTVFSLLSVPVKDRNATI